jgi:integrase
MAREMVRAKMVNDAGLDLSQRSETLEALCKKFVLTRANVAPNTARRDREVITRLIERFGPDRKIRSIPASDLRAFHVGLCKLDGDRKPLKERLSPDYLNKVADILKKIFGLAVEDRAISANDDPSRGLKRVSVPEPKRIAPSWKEFKKIVAAVRSEPNRTDHAEAAGDWIEFAGRAGLGQAEVNSLTWGDVDFAKGVMHVIRKKTRQPYTYYLHPILTPFLRRLKAKAPNAGPNTPIVERRNPRKAIKSACIKLGYPNYTPHTLRRCWATYAFMSGVNGEIVSLNLNHKDSGRLAKMVYFDKRPEFIRAELKKLRDD